MDIAHKVGIFFMNYGPMHCFGCVAKQKKSETTWTHTLWFIGKATATSADCKRILPCPAGSNCVTEPVHQYKQFWTWKSYKKSPKSRMMLKLAIILVIVTAMVQANPMPRKKVRQYKFSRHNKYLQPVYSHCLCYMCHRNFAVIVTSNRSTHDI